MTDLRPTLCQLRALGTFIRERSEGADLSDRDLGTLLDALLEVARVASSCQRVVAFPGGPSLEQHVTAASHDMSLEDALDAPRGGAA